MAEKRRVKSKTRQHIHKTKNIDRPYTFLSKYDELTEKILEFVLCTHQTSNNYHKTLDLI